MEIFLILPHQLFDKKYLNKNYNYILWEHPHYFKKYNYNKKKLLLHFGSMNYYYDYLKSNNFKVKYVSLNENLDITNYLLFDPIDKIELPGIYVIQDSPNFLLNQDIYKKYRNKTKNFLFNAFYMGSLRYCRII